MDIIIFSNLKVVNFKITNNKDNPALNLSSEEKKEFTALLQLIAYCKVNNTQRWDKEKNEFYGDEINFSGKLQITTNEVRK